MILEARNIRKWFDNTTRTDVLKNVSLRVDSGELLYIVGPSGSGKTTLLSIISGILKPDRGTVIFKGTDIYTLSQDDLANFRLYTVGFVFQDFHLFPKFTAQENVAMPLVFQNKSWRTALAEASASLALLGLADRIDVPSIKLSIGEQQRVAIARALVTKPSLLILDEPTASLDSQTGTKIISFVKDTILTKEHAIIIVTHDSRIYPFATRILQLQDGLIKDHIENDDEY